jgi:hypothetical protein
MVSASLVYAVVLDSLMKVSCKGTGKSIIPGSPEALKFYSNLDCNLVTSSRPACYMFSRADTHRLLNVGHG